ncbi:hypothetical protein ACSDR0_23490 [Streptosporangium sp. G11]|uniref:hypothetical protein n=1 Tax=Streptosporangium sp. G11 TaxID=3436926 RepID=UPI003EBB1869
MSENLVLGPKVMTAYSNMVEHGKFKYLIYKIDEAESKIAPEKDGHSSATYDDFLAALPANECRWGLCVMDLGSYGSLCSFEPVFFIWLPDAAPASQKALYEQSRDILTQGFNHVLVFHTVANLADMSHEAVLNRMAVSGPPRELRLPEGEFSIDRLAPKTGQVLRRLRSDSQSEKESYGHAIFKINRYFMYDVAQAGDPASSYDEFLAGLPVDDCRWALYTLDISSLTSDSGADARSTYTFFFSWIPEAAPEGTRDLYYSGSDGTSMGNYDAQFTPSGIITNVLGRPIPFLRPGPGHISARPHAHRDQDPARATSRTMRECLICCGTRSRTSSIPRRTACCRMCTSPTPPSRTGRRSSISYGRRGGGMSTPWTASLSGCHAPWRCRL